MTSTRTIFLATDGRYGFLSSTAGGDLSDIVRAQIVERGLSGWIVDVSGRLYAKRAPKLTRREAVNGATDDQWATAVADFMAAR